MELKITERHIESLYAAKSLFEKQLRNTRKGYEEFRNRTDREGIVILESNSYLIERDQKHLKVLNELGNMKESFMLGSIRIRSSVGCRNAALFCLLYIHLSTKQ